MRKKDFIRIINEEINNFDFLSNEQYLKEQEIYEILENEEFQKQFIIDSITRMREKIVLDDSHASVTNDPDVQDTDQHNDMNLEYHINVTYKYKEDAEPINFDLIFTGDRITYFTDYTSEPGTYSQPPDFNSWYEAIYWNDINVNLYTIDDEEIRFIAFERAPDKIKELFIRTYTEPIIEKYTDVGQIAEKLPQYTPY